jgi:hypothetical protein
VVDDDVMGFFLDAWRVVEVLSVSLIDHP